MITPNGIWTEERASWSDSVLVKRNLFISIAIVAVASIVYAGRVYHFHLDRWDDAFITFRFSQHIADGLGAVWNIGGERVEGFTSVLHVLLISAGIKLGMDPVTGSVVLSVVAVLITLLMILAILFQEFGTIYPSATVAIAIYLIDPVSAVHSTSGLETQVFVATLSVALFFASRFVRKRSGWAVLGFSIAGLLSCFTRPESVLYISALYVGIAIRCAVIEQYDVRSYCSKLIGSIGIFATGLVVYGVLSFDYFGYLLPNPFYVKTRDPFHFGGIGDVLGYLQHTSIWLGPVVLIGVAGLIYTAWSIHGGSGLRHSAADEWQNVRKSKLVSVLLLTLIPTTVALIYYSTIIHEVGGDYRFSYPTYFFFVVMIACTLSAAEARLGGQFHRLAFTATLIVWAAVLLATNRGWEFTTPARMNGFSEHHFRVARALLATGLGPRGSIICDAAGVIPYVSGFNQIDRVGLVDNYLAGRIPASVEEREQYVWSRPADVYMGFEPPASEGSQTPTDDMEMSTPYVRSLMQRELKLVESRIFLQNPSLLHARMRELRDNWKLLGETDWPGWKAWHLKLFIYVRRDSPNAQVLNQDLGSLIDKPVEQIDLSN